MTTRHVVRPGECLTKIAWRYGVADAETILDHPDNAELKRARPNANVLYPGDVVVIPDLSIAKRSLGTSQTHRFRVKRPKKELRLRIEELDGDPIANTPYQLEIGHETREGTTDGDGRLKERIPGELTSATLAIAGRTLRLRLGHLRPAGDAPDDGVSGVQARLANLGYVVGASGQLDPRTRSAIALFQADVELPIDGELTDATRDALIDAHGC